jgi:hypothetical protein
MKARTKHAGRRFTKPQINRLWMKGIHAKESGECSTTMDDAQFDLEIKAATEGQLPLTDEQLKACFQGIEEGLDKALSTPASREQAAAKRADETDQAWSQRTSGGSCLRVRN